MNDASNHVTFFFFNKYKYILYTFYRYEASDPEVTPISALKQHGLEVLKERIEEAVVKYTGKQTMTLKVQLNTPQLA